MKRYNRNPDQRKGGERTEAQKEEDRKLATTLMETRMQVIASIQDTITEYKELVASGKVEGGEQGAKQANVLCEFVDQFLGFAKDPHHSEEGAYTTMDMFADCLVQILAILVHRPWYIPDMKEVICSWANAVIQLEERQQGNNSNHHLH